jgi:hypothetical protein
MRSRGQPAAGPESVIVQCLVPDRRDQAIVRLAPGEDATFGRGGPGHPVRLRIDHPGVGRLAGRITAAEDHWLLSNLCADRTYLVENPEGAGEHVKVAPRRLGAPIPFELARVVLPADPAPLEFVVFAPPHRLADHRALPPPDPETTTALFSLDETAKYFLVLTALCEPRLRDGSSRRCPPTRRSSTGCDGCPRAGASPAARSTSTSTTWPGPSCACASPRPPSARGSKGAAPPWCPSRSASTWSGTSTWPCCRPAWDRCDPLPYPWLNV